MTDYDKLNDPTNHYDGYYIELADELEKWYPDEFEDMDYYEDENEDED